VLLGGALLGEGPWEHELGLEHRCLVLDEAVECRPHPFDPGMPQEALDLLQPSASLPLEPASIEVLGRAAELDEEIAG
jgi:hypothetical protein